MVYRNCWIISSMEFNKSPLVLCVVAAVTILVLIPVSAQMRGLQNKRTLQINQSPRRVQRGISIFPFTDPGCFIQEYAALVGARYGTEAFDREKVRGLIKSYLGAAEMQLETAKMLYLSMRELVPVLALEPVSDEIFKEFENRIKNFCNPNRRLNEGKEDPPIYEAGESEVDEKGEVTEIGETGDTGKEKLDEQNIGTEEGKVDDNLIKTDRDAKDLVEDATQSDGPGDDKQTDAMDKEELESDMLYDKKAGPGDTGEMIKKEETVIDSLQIQMNNGFPTNFGLLESLNPSRIMQLFDILRQDTNPDVQTFMRERLGALAHISPLALPLSWPTSHCQPLLKMNSGQHDCFIVEYAGFVGGYWGTADFDRNLARYILGELTTELITTAALLTCVAAPVATPLFSAPDRPIPITDINEFMDNIMYECSV